MSFLVRMAALVLGTAGVWSWALGDAPKWALAVGIYGLMIYVLAFAPLRAQGLPRPAERIHEGSPAVIGRAARRFLEGRWLTNGEALTVRYMRDEIEGPEYVARADVLLAAGTFDEPLPASGGLGHGIYVGNEVPVIVNFSVRAGHDF